jgi:hypothetical protein
LCSRLPYIYASSEESVGHRYPIFGAGRSGPRNLASPMGRRCRRSSLGDGKRTLTRAYMLFLARWARRLSWKKTPEAFRTSWDKVFDAVEHLVTWGLEHRMLGQIDGIVRTYGYSN